MQTKKIDFGVTYNQFAPIIKASNSKQVETGIYPSNLW